MGFRSVCNRILQVSSLIVLCQDIHLPEMGFRSVCNKILQVSSLIVFCQDIHLPKLLNY
jgi:nitrate reductase NapAB chaperone NapD